MNAEPISIIRIDVLRGEGAATFMLFVDRKEPGWDPWWGRLFTFLLGLAALEGEWTVEEENVTTTRHVALSVAESQRLLAQVGRNPDMAMS